MPFVLRPFRRFPVQCAVTYHAGPFQEQGIVWNLSLSGWRLTSNLPIHLWAYTLVPNAVNPT